MGDEPEATPAEETAPAPASEPTVNVDPIQACDTVETTLAIVKPDAFNNKQHIIAMAEGAGFEVAHSAVMQLDQQQAFKFYSEHYGKNFFDGLIDFMCSDQVLVLALRKENAVADWRSLIGPTSAIRAKESDPESVRAKYGTDNTKNAVHGSASVSEALAELAFFFPKYYVYQRTVAYILPGVDKKKIKEIEGRFGDWQFSVLHTGTVTLTEEQARKAAAFNLAQTDVCIDPSEDENTYLMPYAMRPHDPALDEPPPPPKNPDEEAEPEPEPEPAAAEAEAPADAGEQGRPVDIEELVKDLTAGPMTYYVLGRVGGLHALCRLAGPLDPIEARKNPATAGTLRAVYGTDRMANAVTFCNTPASNLAALAAIDALEEATPNMSQVERTLAIIKPNAFPKAPLIKKIIALNGFTIEDEQTLKLSTDQATEFYKEHEGKEFFDDLKSFMTSGQCTALVLSRPGAIAAWRGLIGPTDSTVAKETQPLSLRSLFGADQTKNGTHGSACAADAQREIEVLFPRFFKYERTLAILKPCVQQRGLTPMVLSRIQAEGFTVCDCKQLSLSSSEASCFFNPNGDMPRAAEAAAYMSSGPSVILVLGRCNAIRYWQRVCGPVDSREAALVAPCSIRAATSGPGCSDIRNSVHASTSPDVANTQIGFFFPSLVASVVRTQGPAQGVNPAAYMEAELQSTLTKGLTQLCKHKPPNPLRWLAEWLHTNNPNKPHVALPPSPPKPLPQPKAKARGGSRAPDTELVLVLDQSMTLTDPSLSSVNPEVTNDLARLMVTECSFTYIDIPTLLEDEITQQSQVGVELDRLRKTGSTESIYMLVIHALQQEMARLGGKKHVITGYPRDMEWVRALEKYVGAPTSVLFLEGTDDVKAETNDLAPCITYFDKKKCLTRIPIKGSPTAKDLYSAQLRTLFFKSKPQHFIYLLGAAASGRSSLAAAIANKYDFRHVSIEQLMVEEMLAKSTIGTTIDSCLKAKRAVDNEIVMQLVKTAIAKDTCKNFVIDGYPGSIDELAGIESVIGVPCDAAIELKCSAAAIEERIADCGDLEASVDPARMIECSRCTTDQTWPSDKQKAVLDYLKQEGKLFEVSAEQFEEDVLMDVEQQVLTGCFKPRSKVFFVLGGPGSGKGTQCTKLVNEYGFTHLSAGDLLRAEVKSGSPDGQMISEMIRNGQIVPAEVTVRLLHNAMESSLSQSFLIDGFPRDMANVAEWEKKLPSPEMVLVFDCPEAELEARLLKRGETSGRSDDNLESIKKRFKTFVDQSMPVIKYYQDRNLVKRVSSIPAPVQVFSQVKKLFSSWPVIPDILFVLGGPGSGKGTQCAKIVEDYGFVHLSAGDLLREEIQRGSKDGAMIAGMIREGKIVSQEVTIRLLQRALHRHPDKNKYLIDGFPRAIGQAKAFEQVVGKAKMCLFFDTSDQVLTDRLLKRGETSGRTDDNAEAIVKRLATYHKQSRPVIGHFESTEPAGFVQKIDATPDVDTVYAEVEKVLSNYSKQKIVWVTGQPLAGKTVLSQRLAQSHDGAHLNFAELLKAETLSNSQTGRKIGGYIKRGEKVPFEIIVQVVKTAVDRAKSGLLILDGFPRKQSEADMLFGLIGEPNVVVYLDTAAAGEPDEVSIERIKQFDTDGDGMLSKEEFVAAGHIGTMLERSEKEGGCASAQDMMKKLNLFTEETVPVVDKYKSLGRVKNIDATKDIEEVVAQVGVQVCQ